MGTFIAQIIGYVAGLAVLGYLVTKFFIAKRYEKKTGAQMSKQEFRKKWIIASIILFVVLLIPQLIA